MSSKKNTNAPVEVREDDLLGEATAPDPDVSLNEGLPVAPEQVDSVTEAPKNSEGVDAPKDTEALAESAIIGTITVTASLLNVRQEPSKTSPVVDTAKRGSTHRALELRDGYYKIDAGWVNAKFVLAE